MALSKPSQVIFNLTAAYFELLYTKPVKTKAITSCIIASLGNIVSQKLCGARSINEDTLIAFGLFGLLIGGPVPHYFYQYVHKLVRNPLGVLFIERLIYAPCFQALSLYLLTRFEGKTNAAAVKQVRKLYIPLLLANWKYITLLQYINIRYVPPMLRVLVVNLIGFIWTIYLANKRSNITGKKSKKN